MSDLLAVLFGFTACYGLAWWTDSKWHWIDRLAGWPK